MGILVDWQIEALVQRHKLLEPYFSTHLQPAGYDLALSRQFRMRGIHKNPLLPVDPWNPPVMDLYHADHIFELPPHTFVLGCSMEYLKIPRDIVGICLSRSTYARSGCFTNVTPLEPGWEGQVTIEIVNLTEDFIKLEVGQGIVQVQFHKLGEQPEADYLQRGGRYQNQTGVTQGHK